MNRHTMSGQNGHSKTTVDIAEAIGESVKTTRRLLQLNELIPQLQRLVSSGKLGTTSAEQDPMKKARIAQFLKEYWGVREGRPSKRPQNGEVKTAEDVASAVGTTAKHLGRLLKLNDLIPSLQRLISSGKLDKTKGEQLAYLTPEVQTALYDALGEEIGERTVAQTKQLRQDAQGKSPKWRFENKLDIMSKLGQNGITHCGVGFAKMAEAEGQNGQLPKSKPIMGNVNHSPQWRMVTLRKMQKV